MRLDVALGIVKAIVTGTIKVTAIIAQQHSIADILDNVATILW